MLRNIISGTQGVMLVAGFKIYEPDHDNGFAAIAVICERDADNQAQLIQNVSFGTAHVISTLGAPLPLTFRW